MAKVYRVLTLEQETESTFKTVAATEWGAELGKARSTMGDVLDNLCNNQVVALASMEAPSTREEFVMWLNRVSVVPKPRGGTKHDSYRAMSSFPGRPTLGDIGACGDYTKDLPCPGHTDESAVD